MNFRGDERKIELTQEIFCNNLNKILNAKKNKINF